MVKRIIVEDNTTNKEIMELQMRFPDAKIVTESMYNRLEKHIRFQRDYINYLEEELIGE